ncbi:hypothetical protein [Pseudonocardia xishanensis]|uniref:Uncharacterized protein n=1 Tax=Pseudonocardia xishanensis TaxID=630995 RepID=A0ABP8S0R8_9PSEU
MQIRRSALALVAAAALGGLTACGSSVETAQCDLASTALNAGQLATAAELYARAQQSGEGTCADTGLDAVGNRYASAFRESARGTALEVVADDEGARAAYQSALALDQNNQPAMNGLTRLGTPQEQRVTSLALPAVAPYPQASWWTGWPIVLPTFLLAVAALVLGGLMWRRAPSPEGPWLTQRHAPQRGSSWRRGRRGGKAGPETDEDWLDEPREGRSTGRRRPGAAAAQPDDAEDRPRPAEPEARAEPRPRPTPPADALTRALRPIRDHEARTDPLTVVTPRPQGLDLGRKDDPPGERHPEPEDDPDRAAARRPAEDATHDQPASPAEPSGRSRPAPGPTEPGAHETAGSEPPPPGAAEPRSAEPQPAEPAPPERPAPSAPPPDPTLTGEIGQLQRLVDRSVRTDTRPVARRYFASGVDVPGPAVAVTLAICDVELTGSTPDAQRLLCVQRLVAAAIPGGDWTPETGVDWLGQVREDVAHREVGEIRDHDERLWATEPRPDDRALLRDLDLSRPAWVPLLTGGDPTPDVPLQRPSTARSSALQAAMLGRESLLSPEARPSRVRVIALVDALLVGSTVTNARVDVQRNEVVALAAAESVEYALARELVALDGQ